MVDPKDDDTSPGAPSSSPTSSAGSGTPSSPPAPAPAPSSSTSPSSTPSSNAIPVTNPSGVIYASLPMHMYPYAPLPHEPLRSKRRQVKNACTNCQKACKKCDDARPCLRCVKYGVADECVDSQRKERKKGVKRGPYKKRDDRGKESDPASSASASVLSAAPHPPLPPNTIAGMQPIPQVPMQVPYFQPAPGYYQPFVPHPSLPPAQHPSLPLSQSQIPQQGKEGGGGTSVIPYYVPMPLPQHQQGVPQQQYEMQGGQGGQTGVYYPYATPYVPYPPYVAHDGSVLGYPVYSVPPTVGGGQQQVGQGVGQEEGEGDK